MLKQDCIIKAAVQKKFKSRNKRILLIDPPYCRALGYSNIFFNLGLGYLSSILGEKGYDTAIYNAEIDGSLKISGSYSLNIQNNYKKMKKFLDENSSNQIWDEITDVVKNYDPWLVGISVLTNKSTIAHKIARIVRSVNPDIKVCFGGHHPTMFPEETLKNMDVDYVITGEAEYTMPVLADYLAGKAGSIEETPNIFYRVKGEIRGFKRHARLENMNNLPFPSRESFLGYEEMPSHTFSSIILSRGCPFSCTYCGSKNIFGRQCFRRSIDNIIGEIDYLNKNFGVHELSLVDDTFNIDRLYSMKVASEIGRYSSKLRWSTNIRLDLADKEQLAIWQENGCRSLWIGIESGSERILKSIKKGFGKDRIREQIRKVTASGIEWNAFFMMGFPGETRDEMKQTLEFIHELKPKHAQINLYNPLPGTELYEAIKKEYKLKNNINWSLQSQTSLKNLRLFTRDRENIEDFVLDIIEGIDEYNRQNA